MPAQATQSPWPYLVPLLVISLIVLRNVRERKLKVERLWIAPLAIIAVIASAFAQQSPPGPAMLALDMAGLALGAVAGWWRGRLTRITVDPATHMLTSKTSAWGMLLILALFAIRYGLRSVGMQTAGPLHLSAAELTDLLMLSSAGLICTQRLEIALRATRMLGEARAGSV